jgi:hypothetical protein
MFSKDITPSGVVELRVNEPASVIGKNVTPSKEHSGVSTSVASLVILLFTANCHALKTILPKTPVSESELKLSVTLYALISTSFICKKPDFLLAIVVYPFCFILLLWVKTWV